MNNHALDILENHEKPELVYHETAESIFDAHWNFEKNLTFEELLKSKCGGADDQPNVTLADMFEATKENGFWAFISLKENKLHLWFEMFPDLELLRLVIGHEIGHIFEEKFDGEEKPDETAEYMRHENNSDLWGVAVVFAMRLSNEYLKIRLEKPY